MKIGFASSDWAVGAIDPATDRPSWGGAGWARCGLPAKTLRAAGLDVVEGTLVWDKRAEVFGVREWPAVSQPEEAAVLHSDLDLVVLQRWMFASVAYESRTARANGQVVVQDVDDHFWALDPRNRAYAATDPRRSMIEHRGHYLDALKAATAVTVSTPYLASEVRRLGVRTEIDVLENHVEVEAFAAVREARSYGASPIVGWVGATPWRSGDVETLRGVLGPFLARHGLLAYHGGHLEGSETFAAQAGLEEEAVVREPMARIGDYPGLFRGLDLGLVPLADHPFNRAKSWIKGLEYAAAGVPFVAQDLPEYRSLEDLGVGRTARRPRDWDRLLRGLLDPDARRAEAERNLAAVKALDIAQATQWRDLYLSLLANS